MIQWDSHIYSSIVSFPHSLARSLAHWFACASPYVPRVSSPFLAVAHRMQLRLSLAFWLHSPINPALDSTRYVANPSNWTSHAVHATWDYSLKSAANSQYSVSASNHLIIGFPCLSILTVLLIPTRTAALSLRSNPRSLSRLCWFYLKTALPSIALPPIVVVTPPLISSSRNLAATLIELTTISITQWQRCAHALWFVVSIF